LSLQNKIAIVTGAASERGIGFASARKLAEQSAHVVLIDLEHYRTELEQRVATLQQEGCKAELHCCDLTDEPATRALIAQTIKTHGRIDILFNNAGMGEIKPFLDTPVQEFELIYRINMLTIVTLCQAVVPQMTTQGGGVIINNASIAGLYGNAFYTAYSASKHAVVGFTKALALELAELNIRVNAVCPGFTDTEMADNIPAFFSDLMDISMKEARQLCYDAIGMKRPGQPAEVADLVAFLAGDSSTYISGTAIPVAGAFPPGL